MTKLDKDKLKQMQFGKGFIAALDQSGGSTPKTLKLYGIDEKEYETNGEKDENKMFDLVHEMRTRVIKSKEFTNEKILGAILFRQTMERKIDGEFTAEYLWNKKHIVSFLKCDLGLGEEANGVRLMKPITNLDEVLKEANEHGIFGTKMRSVINSYNEEGIKEIVEQQFNLAKKISEYNLVPIIEPETTITSPDREKSEALLHDLIKKNLSKLPAKTKVMIKVSIPLNNHLYDDLLEDKHVVRIVALSGGYPREEANKLLKKTPGLIASFSRALLEELRYQQTPEEFDEKLKAAIDSIYDASVNKE